MNTEGYSVKTLPRQLIRRAPRGLGLWRLFTYPKVFVANGMNDGFFNTAMKNTWRRQMEDAAHRLDPVEVDAPAELSRDIYFLTGRNF